MLAVTAPVFVSVVPDTRGMLPQERYTYSVPEELLGLHSTGGAGPGPLRCPLPARPRGRAPGPIRPRRRPPHLRRPRRGSAPLRGSARAGRVGRRALLRAAPRGPQGDGAQGGAERRRQRRPAPGPPHHLRRHHGRAGRGHAAPAAGADRGAATGRRPAPRGDRRRAAPRGAAPRGDRQRQDRDLPGRHRRRPGPRPPGDLPGPRDRPDPSDDPPLRGPLSRAAGGQPLWSDRCRARGRMAPGPARRDRCRGRVPERRLCSPAAARGGGRGRGGRLRLQAGPGAPLPCRRRRPRAGPAGGRAGGAGQRHPAGGDVLPGPHRLPGAGHPTGARSPAGRSRPSRWSTSARSCAPATGARSRSPWPGHWRRAAPTAASRSSTSTAAAPPPSCSAAAAGSRSAAPTAASRSSTTPAAAAATVTTAAAPARCRIAARAAARPPSVAWGWGRSGWRRRWRSVSQDCACFGWTETPCRSATPTSRSTSVSVPERRTA